MSPPPFQPAAFAVCAALVEQRATGRGAGQVLDQFTGREIFTMAGEARFVKAVEFAGQRLHPQPPAPEGQDRGAGRKSSLRVVK